MFGARIFVFVVSAVLALSDALPSVHIGRHEIVKRSPEAVEFGNQQTGMRAKKALGGEWKKFGPSEQLRRGFDSGYVPGYVSKAEEFQRHGGTGMDDPLRRKKEEASPPVGGGKESGGIRKKQQRPANEQLQNEQRPANEQLQNEQRPTNKQQPTNEQLLNEQRPTNEQLLNEQQPTNERLQNEQLENLQLQIEQLEHEQLKNEQLENEQLENEQQLNNINELQMSKSGENEEADKSGEHEEAGKSGEHEEAGKSGEHEEAGKSGEHEEAGKSGEHEEAGKSGLKNLNSAEEEKEEKEEKDEKEEKEEKDEKFATENGKSMKSGSTKSSNDVTSGIAGSHGVLDSLENEPQENRGLWRDLQRQLRRAGRFKQRRDLSSLAIEQSMRPGFSRRKRDLPDFISPLDPSDYKLDLLIESLAGGAATPDGVEQLDDGELPEVESPYPEFVVDGGYGEGEPDDVFEVNPPEVAGEPTGRTFSAADAVLLIGELRRRLADERLRERQLERELLRERAHERETQDVQLVDLLLGVEGEAVQSALKEAAAEKAAYQRVLKLATLLQQDH